jgi:hypothetical protein
VFEGFKLEYLDVGEVTLRVRHGGARQPVVLQHGHLHTTWHLAEGSHPGANAFVGSTGPVFACAMATKRSPGARWIEAAAAGVRRTRARSGDWFGVCSLPLKRERRRAAPRRCPGACVGFEGGSLNAYATSAVALRPEKLYGVRSPRRGPNSSARSADRRRSSQLPRGHVPVGVAGLPSATYPCA